MPFDIRPLTPDDLPDLSRFLTEGFRAPAGSAFAAEDVLRWKYLDDRGAEAGEAPRSYLARDSGSYSNRVVGHVGVCPGRFHGAGLPPEGVSTLHMIDWLASEAGAGVGATLMRRAHQATETQFGFGGSDAGRGVIDRGGYGLIQRVPVYQRVLRPSYRLRVPGHGLAGRALRAAKDAAGRLARPARRPVVSVELRPVGSFGDEIRTLLDAYEPRAVFTTRAPDFLNHVLRYPRGGLTGWHLVRAGDLIGFAVLSLVPQPGGVRLGKVAECLIPADDDPLWHAAAVALTRELNRQRADVAQAFASTDWSARAWRAAGYAPVHDLEFRLRDRSDLLPRGAAFHLTPLEADYAYT
jgi:hypothetical protein